MSLLAGPEPESAHQATACRRQTGWDNPADKTRGIQKNLQHLHIAPIQLMQHVSQHKQEDDDRDTLIG